MVELFKENNGESCLVSTAYMHLKLVVELRFVSCPQH